MRSQVNYHTGILSQGFWSSSQLLVLALACNPNAVLAPPSLRHSILITIDLEFAPNPIRITQIGISTLDTSELSQFDSLDDQAIGANAVKSYCYDVRSKPKRTWRNNPQYEFGVPETIIHSDIQKVLQDHLSVVDKHGQPRNIILVGHSIDQDIN